MAQHYLLPCECGNATEVSVTQAGGTVACACGRAIRVPSLAGLRSLTPVEPASAAPTRRRGGTKGIVWTMVALALCAAALVAGLSAWNEHHYQLALQALEQREFEQADQYLQQRMTLGFGSLQAELLGIRTARRSGNIDEAGKRLRRCQKRFAGEPGIELEEELLAMQQGDLEHAQELLDAHATSNSEEAAWVLEAYIVGCLQNSMPAYAQNLTYEGSSHAKELAQARRAIDRWLELRPDKPDQVEGLVWRYQAHLFSHFLGEARSDIDQALELDPNHRLARTMLAMHLTQEHPEESAAQWQWLHEQNPADISVTMNLADVRRRLGQLEAAQSLLDDALAADPRNVPALIERGRIAIDMQETPAAEEWFRRACREDPDSVEANLGLSRCLRAAGNLDEADRLQAKIERLQAERTRQREAFISSSSP